MVNQRGTGEGAATYTSGIGVGGLLGVAFVVLKLCGVINWSWWWVLLPFYGPAALVIVCGIVAAVGVLLVATGNSMKNKLKNKKKTK